MGSSLLMWKLHPEAYVPEAKHVILGVISLFSYSEMDYLVLLVI